MLLVARYGQGRAGGVFLDCALGSGMEIVSGPNELKRAAAAPLADAGGATELDGGDAGLLGFAKQVLGWTLEDKQRELLEGPGKRVILNCTRQWGKSWMAAVALLYHALQNPGSLSLIAGPTQMQSAELLEKVKRLAGRIGLKPKGDGIRRHSAVFPGQARVVAVPGRSADTIRGSSDVTMMVFDEAAMMRDEVYAAARPALTQKDGAIWLLSTPKGKKGFFEKEFRNGAENWRRVVAPATECPRFTREALEAEKASLGERLFSQEFLCEFVETNDGLFDEAWFAEVFQPGVAPLKVEW